MDNFSFNKVNPERTSERPAFQNICGEISGLGDILMFPYEKETKNYNLSNNSKKSSKVIYMKKLSWLWNRFQRKLINESVGTFLSIQKISKENRNELKNSLSKKSREYRSMVQVSVAEMNELLENLENGRPTPIFEDPEVLKTNCDLLYKMELVLGLVEVIFIESHTGGMVLNHLMNWIQIHFPTCRQRMSECLASDKPTMNPYYWETCYGLILQGLFDESRELISRHPDSNMDCFLSIDELLRKMPVFTAYGGVSEAEFIVRWQHWQSECESRLKRGEFSGCSQLVTICKILCGDKETMVNLSDVLDTWYHFMVSQLLFTNPTIKIHRLAMAAQEAIAAFGVDSHISSLDQLLISILEMNDNMVLKQIHTVIDNMWFTVHLTDLLYHASDSKEKSYLCDVRESQLLDYGCELMSHRSLWQVGLLYLDHVDEDGSVRSTVLQRIPLNGGDCKALKIIHSAKKHNVESVATGICRVMGRKAFQNHCLGSAIWWGIRSQDSAFTSHLAHKILMRYMEEGRFESSSLLDHLGPSMLLSDTLTFLSKYREFHTLYQEGEIKKAASLLVSLIASRIAPEYFWPILLEDALPLLQSPDPVITAEQTYKLMYCLHNLLLNHKEGKNEFKLYRIYESFGDKESTVRLALTNNLARAIIKEGVPS